MYTQHTLPPQLASSARRQPFLTVAIALATVPQEGVGSGLEGEQHEGGWREMWQHMAAIGIATHKVRFVVAAGLLLGIYVRYMRL